MYVYGSEWHVNWKSVGLSSIKSLEHILLILYVNVLYINDKIHLNTAFLKWWPLFLGISRLVRVSSHLACDLCSLCQMHPCQCVSRINPLLIKWKWICSWKILLFLFLQLFWIMLNKQILLTKLIYTDSHVHQKFLGIITKKLSWLSSGYKIYLHGSFRLNCFAGKFRF